MVRALLDGRKTMTRRIPTPQWLKVVPGDRLYVRERCVTITGPQYRGVRYIADGADDGDLNATSSENGQWDAKSRPSIHMPRWASRLTLVVTATKIEKLQKICNADAIAEGCGVSLDHPTPEKTREPFPVEAFRRLWSSLHGPASWDANPEVVALTFTVHAVNIDRMAKEAA